MQKPRIVKTELKRPVRGLTLPALKTYKATVIKTV